MSSSYYSKIKGNMMQTSCMMPAGGGGLRVSGGGSSCMGTTSTRARFRSHRFTESQQYLDDTSSTASSHLYI